MLRELHINNLAVIADARLELHPRLNCFTGATGAGKSLVIGAVELLLGLRSPSEMLRPGAEEGRVSGVFEMTDPQTLLQIGQATDLPVAADGGEILLSRRLYASGRTSVSLNGHPITLSMLRQVSESLVDVHGQHDHQYLLKPSNQLEVLDRYAGLLPLRERHRQTFERLQSIVAQLESLSSSQSLRSQQLELYRFQANEIDAAELDIAEFDELQARATLLQNLEKLKKDAGATHSALYECDGSVLDRLKMIAAIVAELSTLDKSLAAPASAIRDATLQLEDAAFDLGRYLDKLDLDPAELAEVNDRLNTIHRVLKKYGESIEGTLAHRQEIGLHMASLERETGDLSVLQKQMAPLRKELAVLSAELSARRLRAAAELSPLIERQLAELGMEKATFSIALTAAAEPTSSGSDIIEFIVRTNPGLLPQPLRRIASGGELSRIMLALKGVLAAGDRVSVLVFDEIDANVGGRLGSIIGEKLRGLAAHHQVLCITHLPQIASYADRHLTVRKETIDGETRTTVRVMEGAERLEELAEMIGGHQVTAVTRAQAEELLAAARGSADKLAPRIPITTAAPTDAQTDTRSAAPAANGKPSPQATGRSTNRAASASAPQPGFSRKTSQRSRADKAVKA